MKSKLNNNIDKDYSADTSGVKYTNSKIETDFFDEAKYVKEKLVRVRRTLVGKNERWKILEDSKIIFVVEGTKISKREKEFLRTIDGCQFLITQGKKGIRSLGGLRKELRLHIK